MNEEKETGVWLIRTATVIPDNERWLHEPQAAADLVDDDISAGRKPPTKEAGKKKRGKIATVEGDDAEDGDDEGDGEPKAKPAKGDAKKTAKGKKGK